MIFETKKIQLETLSEYLRSVRENLGLGTQEVSQKTGIKPKFVQALESGDFKLLPADVYVMGFLRQLSQLYSVDTGELINQYKKEKGIQQQVIKHATLLDAHWYNKIFGKLVVTPKILSLILGLLFVALSVAYIVWQVWSINKTPSLQIFSPANNAVVQSAALVISGKTDPSIQVTVNGQNIFVDSGGLFQTQIGIGPGPKQITVIAENRFGKSASQSLNVTGAADLAPGGGELVLKLDFNGAVNLTYSIDGQPQQSLSFNAGDSKTFTAGQKILVSTSDAGATLVTLNGQALGVMGKPKEQLSNIAFYPQATTTPAASP